MIEADGPRAVLFITGWWPSASNAHDGIFVREHALAVQTQQQVLVIHLTVSKSVWPRVIWREESDDGLVVLHGEIRTPMRRGGVHDRLVRFAYRTALQRLKKRFRFRTMHVHVRTPITENAPNVGSEFGLPTVVTEHSSFYHIWIDRLPPGERESTEARVKRWFAQPNIRAILPVSQDLAQVLKDRYGVHEGKLHVVPNVASPLFRPRSVPPPPPFRIALAARWSEPKDPDLFLDALRKLPPAMLSELRVDWAGDGELYDEAKRSAKDLTDQGIVRFTGRLQKTELAKLIGESHLLVHPTKAENLPCIIIESLCCGTPVLSTAVNGIPELVDDTNGVLCRPNDPDAFATALLRIKSTPNLFDRSSIASAAFQRFSQERVASQLMAIYDRITSK